MTFSCLVDTIQFIHAKGEIDVLERLACCAFHEVVEHNHEAGAVRIAFVHAEPSNMQPGSFCHLADFRNVLADRDQRLFAIGSLEMGQQFVGTGRIRQVNGDGQRYPRKNGATCG